VELSALRRSELEPLIGALDELDLAAFEYISFHAPSAVSAADEQHVVELLSEIARRGWPVVVHPDVIHEPLRWRPLRTFLCLENLDRRKPGRSAQELEALFSELPDATFCFDIGHAWQVDHTMREARQMLGRFSRRLRQVHLSEVNSSSRHQSLSEKAIDAFREHAELIPDSIPVILEAPTAEEEIEAEIERARRALPLLPAPAVSG
jgi:hypothetical protein